MGDFFDIQSLCCSLSFYSLFFFPRQNRRKAIPGLESFHPSFIANQSFAVARYSSRELVSFIMASTPPLSQGFGYGIVIGLGFAFAIGMILTTYLLKRYNNEVQTSEMFSTAGRTVKTGLVASAVVSSWTWAATLLQSSGVAYRYVHYNLQTRS